MLVALQTLGIDLTSLNVLAGALGVGIGFGLQNVANNFISGLIIMFQRPIKVGDRIEVGEVNGKVIKISSRSTTVVTNDNISIIVPNADFISKNVVNWSYGDPKIRFRIPVGVSYDSDIDKVEKILLKVAEENEGVLDDPKPSVRLLSFGDSALKFELHCWSEALLHRRAVLFSDLNFAILRSFREEGVQIPFPQ